MSLGKTITLSNGSKIPQIGLGTWLSKPNEVENAVEIANQHEVGAALKKIIPSVVKREDLFITSKLWNSGHQPNEVEKELDETLAQLGIDYLDLYLDHWPIAFASGRGLFPSHPSIVGQVELDSDTTLVDTWKAMIKLPKSKVRPIGVSNFTIEHLEGIINATGVVPTMNQVEAHPLLPQDGLVAYCKEKNIHITAYSPLGNNLVGKPQLTDHAIVQEVAKKLNATPAQVLVAWGVHRGYSVIPKSVQEQRIISNFKQVELSQEDYEKLTSIVENNRTRFNIPITTCDPLWDINTFDEPEERDAKYHVNIQ